MKKIVIPISTPSLRGWRGEISSRSICMAPEASREKRRQPCCPLPESSAGSLLTQSRSDPWNAHPQSGWVYPPNHIIQTIPHRLLGLRDLDKPQVRLSVQGVLGCSKLAVKRNNTVMFFFFFFIAKTSWMNLVISVYQVKIYTQCPGNCFPPVDKWQYWKWQCSWSIFTSVQATLLCSIHEKLADMGIIRSFWKKNKLFFFFSPSLSLSLPFSSPLPVSVYAHVQVCLLECPCLLLWRQC